MHERDVFIAAVEIKDPTSRREYLDSACAGNPSLRVRVERLLDRDAAAGDFLEQPAADLLSDPSAGEIKPVPVTGESPTQFGGDDDTGRTALMDLLAPASSTGSRSPARHGTATGKLFGRYQVDRVLGSGGMGVVYLAEDLRLGRRVALKIPKFDADGRFQLIERFRREARTMASVLHRNLCPIFDVDEQDGTHYLTMAYIDGETLAEVIKHGLERTSRPDLSDRGVSGTALAAGSCEGSGVPKPAASGNFTTRQIAELIRKLALALEKAHRAGVIHRDLKPANVMIDREGEPILMDFGLAWMVHESDSRVTQSGVIVGTPAYMSPEQAEGDPDHVGAASDIYSLGAILYELLAGRPIHTGSVTRVLFQLMHKAPVWPSEIRDDVDPQLEAICSKAIARRPEDRFASAADFAEALASFLDGRWEGEALGEPSLLPQRGSAGASNPRSRAVLSDKTELLPQNLSTDAIAYERSGGSLASRSKSRIVLASLLLIGLIGVVWGIVAERTKPPGGDIVQDIKPVAPDSAADSTLVKPNAEPDGDTDFALEFDGVSTSYVAIPTLINDEPGPVTLEAWVETNERQIRAKIIVSFSGKRFTNLCVNEVNWFANDLTTLGLPETPWTPGLVHLAFVNDDREGRLYIDGKRVARRPRTNERKGFEEKHAWLGAGLYNDSPNYFFRGRIGEVRVSQAARYDQDFTPAKRLDTDQHTLALYHFDEGSGDVLKDSSGHAHHGQIVGAKWVKTELKRSPASDLKRVAPDSTPVKPNAESDGLTGFALEFDGVSSHVAIPTLINDEPGPVTLEAWTETTQRMQGSKMIVTFAGKRLSALCVSDKNWFANDSTLQGHPETPWKPGLAHLASVIDDREGRLYIDGKLVSRRPRTNERKGDENKHAWLGTGLYNGSLNYFFRGRLGEVRVSKVARYEQDFTPAKRFDTDQDTLALYHFDEGSGDVLNDSSGHGHHGKIVGAKWVHVAAKASPAADLSEILTSPNWEWSVPENLGPAVNTDSDELCPHFSADGQRLWFHRDHASSTHRAWISDRESPDRPWMPAKSVGSAFEFNGPMGDMFVSRDERTWIFVTWEGQTRQRLFESLRSSRLAEWSHPKLISAAGSPAQFPVLTDDGLTLYFTNGHQSDSLYAMSRPHTTAPWSEPIRLESPFNSIEGVRAVWISTDSLVLVFHSVQGNDPKQFDLWLTTRPSPTEPWQEPVSFGPAINTSANEKGACLSDDGRELVFESDRPGGFGATDLYVSRRVPKRTLLDIPAAPHKLELGAQLPSVTQATGLKLGDLDGDGDLDLFAARLSVPSMVLLNDGQGGFTDSGQQLGDNACFAVALGDLDGDRDLDAFVCNSDKQENAIWLNDGRGTFQRSPQSFPPSTSNDVALADVDGDKDLDVVVSNFRGSVEIWINDGAGQFVNRQSISRLLNTGVAMGDLDGDGDADLVMTCFSGDNGVWLNDGQGHFTDSEQTLELEVASSVALGDLDQDGDFDLFITGHQGSQAWFNDGHGRFRASEQLLGEGKCEAVELVDLDADHDLDAVTIGGGWNDLPRTVWLNNGQGRFQADPLLSPNNSQSLSTGDLDGDGDADIVFGNVNRQQRPAEVWFNQTNQSTIP